MSDASEGEVYYDVVGGVDRVRRGKRKHSHGPYSGAEKKMERAYQYMKAQTHWMDGELSDMVSLYLAAQFAAYQEVLKRYSYNEMPDPQPEDWERLREELGIPAPVGEDDELDVGGLV
jgi:hypothetical protein